MLEIKEKFNPEIEEMLKAGLHFGHQASKLHPKMEPFVFGLKNNVYIIDLEKTAQKLKEALAFIKKLSEEKKIILFVGTGIQHKEIIESIARECKHPYVKERWLGGLITNFPIMKERLKYLKELEEKEKKGELEKYTKKEKLLLEREIHALRLKFEGIKNLEDLPDAIFISDVKENSLAAKEARAKGIAVIGICDTNTDPETVDYPIPANDDAISSVKYILEKVKETILETGESRIENNELRV